MGKEVVKELIQGDMNERAVEKELRALLDDNAYRERMRDNYDALWKELEQSGNASSLAATEVIRVGERVD
jgi:lipid A disaccharide synthetase